VQTLIFTILGANAYLWQLRHVKSHHVFPNVNGCDIDIDDTNFMRLSPNQGRHWHHRFQHLYAPFIFWLVDLHTVFYQDFVYLFRKRLANMLDIRHPPHQYAIFILSKSAYVAIIFVIPMIVMDHPWWVILIGAFITTCTISILFVALLIGTHFCEETAFPSVGAEGRIGHSWAMHAMVTSLDWNPTSRLANFIAGGANAHAAHHLFPTVAHIHYVAITKIIQNAAWEFDIPYHQTTLPKMIASHCRFLRKMGQGEEATNPVDTAEPQTA
jgi:linoleoyl-CoA desaturase